MDKPITVVYEEFKQELTNLINNSGLPAFLVEPVLQNYLNETKLVAEKQYQLDKSQYEKFLAEQNKSKQTVKE